MSKVSERSNERRPEKFLLDVASEILITYLRAVIAVNSMWKKPGWGGLKREWQLRKWR